MTSATFLPYARQDITDADVAAVAAALREPFITQGPTIDRFERAIADRVGARHCVAFSSGTAALHAAAFAAGIEPGDEIASSPITFAASTNCGVYLGAHPRFVDIDSATWNIDAAAAAASIGPRTKAIVPVSFAGLPVDLEPLARWATASPSSRTPRTRWVGTDTGALWAAPGAPTSRSSRCTPPRR